MTRGTREAAELGAAVVSGGAHFRVWAPRARRVELVLESDGARSIDLEADGEGFFAVFAPGVRAGALYRFRLDGEGPYPDPCSRFQPEGPHGPSLVVDPSSFRWTDESWRGATIRGQVLYEMHIGTFTEEGSFDAAARRLPALRRLGVTMLEIMPLAGCSGRWNWGYDGVALFAPSHHYGDPEAFKRFVDAAHRAGLAVILDVVCNHLGPDGSYIRKYTDDFFAPRHTTDWGDAINFDGERSGPVRAFFLQNAAYWISEFHLDGLRVDATQNIHDDGPSHILREIASRAREAAAPKPIVIVGENEPQDVRLVGSPERGGFGFDALWNDDFHHAARVALTGRREAYYTDYLGSPQEFVSMAKHGFLYQGQRYSWQKQRRGTAVTGEPAPAFVVYIQNHDQIANSLWGRRLHIDAGLPRFRAMTGLLLLLPQTPMLFMGQEHASSRPFLFFVDHNDGLRPLIKDGRCDFLSQFPSFASAEACDALTDPSDPAAFESSKLDGKEAEEEGPIWRLHRDLLAIRRDDPVIAEQDRRRLDGAVLGPEAFLLRWFGEENGDRMLLVNFGRDLVYDPAPEPLLAPPGGSRWSLVWTSDHPGYGGPGVVPPEALGGWRLPSQCAILLRSESRAARAGAGASRRTHS